MMLPLLTLELPPASACADFCFSCRENVRPSCGIMLMSWSASSGAMLPPAVCARLAMPARRGKFFETFFLGSLLQELSTGKQRRDAAIFRSLHAPCNAYMPCPTLSDFSAQRWHAFWDIAVLQCVQARLVPTDISTTPLHVRASSVRLR